MECFCYQSIRNNQYEIRKRFAKTWQVHVGYFIPSTLRLFFVKNGHINILSCLEMQYYSLIYHLDSWLAIDITQHLRSGTFVGPTALHNQNFALC